jgi:hypothetical protein
VHQWRDTDRGLRELRRVSRGPVVVLTFDGTALDRFWLAQYVPELIEAERSRYPAIERIAAVLGGRTAVTAAGRLRRDLESGEWDRRHGALRTQPEFDGSLRLVTSNPAG